jgi:8-oxo-dGTP pyrophosphatase MutT (NUDIX family)
MFSDSTPVKRQHGAKVLLRNPDGLYLFMLRSDIMNGETERMWDVPGGRLEIDPVTDMLEDPIGALDRELYEETRMRLVGPRPEHIATQEIDLRPRGIAKVVLRQTFTADAHNGIVLLSDEHTESRWLDPQTALETITLDRYLPAVLRGDAPGQTRVHL